MNDNQMKQKTLLLKQSIKLLESLHSCWSDEVLVFSHSDKFLRLSLQLISRYNYHEGYLFSFFTSNIWRLTFCSPRCPCIIRYTTWLSSGLAARKASDGSSSSPADSEWALSVPVEDFIYVCRIYNSLNPYHLISVIKT